MTFLDITFDMETCALAPTAAVMSIGAVAWKRYDPRTPFILQNDKFEFGSTFSVHIDLRSMFLEGYTFDQSTAEWWARQSQTAKDALLASDDEQSPCSFIDTAIRDFFAWIELKKAEHHADQVCLWSQGSDFDIAILRNICHKCNITIPVKYTLFRDHRTFYLEGARIICDSSGVEFDPAKAYSLVDNYQAPSAAHDPLYDCKRSIYSTWQMMNHLRVLHKKI